LARSRGGVDQVAKGNYVGVPVNAIHRPIRVLVEMFIVVESSAASKRRQLVSATVAADPVIHRKTCDPIST